MRVLLAILLAVATVTQVHAQTPAPRSDQPSISGTAVDLLTPADSGDVSVVSVGGSSDGNYIQFVVHNGTDETISSVQVKIEVRDSAGTLLKTDIPSDRDIRPMTTKPGEFAIGNTFVSGAFSPGFVITAKVINYEVGPHDRNVSLEFTGVNLHGDTIAGELINTGDSDLDDIYVVGVCFDATGRLVAGNTENIEEPIIRGEPVTFSVDTFEWGDALCASFLVAG